MPTSNGALSLAVKELLRASNQLLRSETELASAEAAEGIKKLEEGLLLFGLAVGIGIVGAISILLFALFALGTWLGGHYGWVALALGILLFGAGAALLRQARTKLRGLAAFPVTRQSLEDDFSLIQGKLRNLPSREARR